jgi:concanavalin A-like lectin/glucanase superfamily protein
VRRARSVAVAFAGAAAVLAGAWLVAEPWHGPIVLNLSSGHGVPLGDLVAVPLIGLALWIGLRTRARPGRDGSTWRWAGPVSAAALGLLLLVVGVVDLADHGPLVPAGGGTFDGTVLYVAGPSASPVDAWTHVALTDDGTRLRLYVDGRRVAAREAAGTTPATASPLWIGGNEPYGEHFDGSIDDVRVYDRALGAAELRADMATPVAARSPGAAGPVAAYSFDAVTGGSVDDLSGHGNAGTIAGATWTARGRHGGALSFDGDAVAVPASPSLDLGPALTLSAWVRPAAPQAGWRTVIHRERDVYFLTASSGLEGLEGRADDLLAGSVIAAAVAGAVATAATRGRWLGERRRSWPVAVGVLLAGFVVDAVASPSATLFGPLLLAAWFAATAHDRLEAIAGWLAAAGLAAATFASLTDLVGVAARMERDDGGLARSAALGVTLLAVGLVRLVSLRRERAAPG